MSEPSDVVFPDLWLGACPECEREYAHSEWELAEADPSNVMLLKGDTALAICQCGASLTMHRMDVKCVPRSFWDEINQMLE